jgi:hypothetical protein
MGIVGQLPASAALPAVTTRDNSNAVEQMLSAKHVNSANIA